MASNDLDPKQEKKHSRSNPDEAVDLYKPGATGDSGSVYNTSGSEASDPTGEPAENRKGSETNKTDAKSAEELSEAEENISEHDENEDVEHENQVGAGYISEEDAAGKPNRQNLSFFGKNRGRILIGGGIGAVIVAIFVSLFSFFNVFKLDSLMSNVDQAAFERNSAVRDKMSSKMMSEYIKLRLAEIEDPDKAPKDRDNLILRADRVDTNNPLIDWYKTMRASKFEEDLFNKHGIKFVSVSEPGKIRKAGIVTINGEDISFEVKEEVRDAINRGDYVRLNNELAAFVKVEIYEKRSDFRQALNGALADLTRSEQVWKRRHLRKSITNMTGIRSWVFFSGPRDKIDQKQLDIRNKIITAAVPENIKTGKTLKCLFGISHCRGSRDAADPENQAAGRITSAPREGANEVDTGKVDKEGKAIKTPIDSSALLSQILKSANIYVRAIDIVGSLDMLTYVDHNISNLTKLVVVARGTQAMGLYQVFETSRDQTRSGEVNPVEVDEFMKVINNAASSEGWSKAVAGEGDSTKLTNTKESKEYCSEDSQAKLEKDPNLPNTDPKFYYAYLCPSEQIGNASRAKTIEKNYENSIGKVVSPIVGAYSGAKSIPIVGHIIDALGKLSSLISKISSSLINAVMKALGVEGKVQDFMKWVFGKVASFLGAGPIMSGKEPAGVYFNWLVQGGAYTAESTARQEGAALTTDRSQASAQQLLASYQVDKKASMSLYDRVASLNNPDSLAYKGTVFASSLRSDFAGSVISGIGNIGSGLGNSFASMFGMKAAAADVDGYTASNFAGIETFDYPAKCTNRDLVNAKPLGGTNALDVFENNNVNPSDANLTKLKSWDVEINSELFYKVIYDVLKDKKNADDIAVHIYNCNLLDNAVRGSLGYIYGFTKDNGLDDSASTSSTSPTNPSPVPTTNSPGAPNDCAAGSDSVGTHTGYNNGAPIQVSLCAIGGLAINDFTSGQEGSESTPGTSYYIEGADSRVLVESSVSKDVVNMVNAAKADGLTLKAFSSFRTNEHQTILAAGGGGYAKPGYSQHQRGFAIDFIDSNRNSTANCRNIAGHTVNGRCVAPGDPIWEWLNKNASKFGYKQLFNESWHWSPSGE